MKAPIPPTTEPPPPPPPPPWPQNKAVSGIENGFGWFEEPELLSGERRELINNPMYQQVVRTIEEGGHLRNLIWEALTETKMTSRSQLLLLLKSVSGPQMENLYLWALLQ